MDWRWIGLIGIVSFLAACRPVAGPADISGHVPDLAFTLTADDGRQVTQADYHGSVVLMYFGYAGCSAQCPTTLARLARLVNEAATPKPSPRRGKAFKVKVLFVSIDPEHDTPKGLHVYLAGFGNTNMTGLTGSPEAIRAMARRYRVAYQPAQGTLVHSGVVYIFDKAGHARALATPEDSDAAILERIKEIVRS